MVIIDLIKFCRLPSEITAAEVQLLNKDLPTKKLEDTPINSRSEVDGYICNVLLNNSVSIKIKPAFEVLLEESRASIR